MLEWPRDKLTHGRSGYPLSSSSPSCPAFHWWPVWNTFIPRSRNPPPTSLTHPAGEASLSCWAFPSRYLHRRRCFKWCSLAMKKWTLLGSRDPMTAGAGTAVSTSWVYFWPHTRSSVFPPQCALEVMVYLSRFLLNTWIFCVQAQETESWPSFLKSKPAL